jgi:hypothetical protein
MNKIDPTIEALTKTFPFDDQLALLRKDRNAELVSVLLS